jgi:Protein of unknown function (DUF2628)
VTVYSVYEPPDKAPEVLVRAEALAFVKEGFSWPALLVPGLWLLFQRMWLEFVLFVVLFVVLGWLLGQSDQGKALFSWISLGIVVLFAAEANDLRRAALERRGWREVGVAIGQSREAAEVSFFRSWLPEQERSSRERPLAPDARRQTEVPPRKPGGESEEVIGLFPQP